MAQPDRGLNVAAWIASVLLCVLFLYAGPPKWRGAAEPVEMFHQFGYSDGFRVFIGVCETLGGIALLFPIAAFWAACGLFVIMVGAVYSHLANGQAALVGAPVLAAFMLGFVAWVRRPQAMLLAPRQEVKS
jgi:uncharacterized membrane protein YphA (DoxX/SURF4 family)